MYVLCDLICLNRHIRSLLMSAVSTIARIKEGASNRDFFQLGNSSNDVKGKG